MNQLDLKVQVSDEVLGQLRVTADERELSINDIVSEMLEGYYDDPTHEEILKGIREGMRDALAGRTRPAREVLAELKQEQASDANPG